MPKVSNLISILKVVQLKSRETLNNWGRSCQAPLSKPRKTFRKKKWTNFGKLVSETTINVL